MSKPSEGWRGARASQRAGLAVVAAGALLCMLLPALPPARAGVATEDARSAFDAAASAPAAAPAGPPRFQLRCWQRGRLVIEESGLELPAAGPAANGAATGSVRLRATDVNRQPLYLTETHNATCLLRPLPAGRHEGALR
jgi:hypothetical protein